MHRNAVRRWGSQAAVIALLAGVASVADVAPAAAQLAGLPPYVWGYTVVPDPPLVSAPTTLELWGVYPTACGEVRSVLVVDAHHVSVHLRSTACPDTSSGNHWVAVLPLGELTAGMNTVDVSLVMERPDSATVTYSGSVTFEVVGGSTPPPPPPPPPPPVYPFVQSVTTDPYPPRPGQPMALIVSGWAPFGCPVPTAATVVDTSHLSLTLTPGAPCPGDTASRYWTQRFEMGQQREGWHHLSLLLLLAGETVDTVTTPVDFLVISDSVAWGPPPPDSLDHVLSSGRPNPFVSETRFSVSTDSPQDVDVAVFDLQGRRVSQVFHGRLPSGTTELAWNGHRDDGTRAVAGVYFYRLEMRGRVISRRLVLLRQH